MCFRESKFNDKIQSVSKQNEAAKEDLKDAAILIASVASIQTTHSAIGNNISKTLDVVDKIRADTEERILDLDANIPNLIDLQNKAEKHVLALNSRVSRIVGELKKKD